MTRFISASPDPSDREPVATDETWVRWVLAFDPTVDEDALDSVPKSIREALYKNIMVYGPNGDETRDLLDAVKEGVEGYHWGDGEEEALITIMEDFLLREYELKVLIDEAIEADLSLLGQCIYLLQSLNLDLPSVYQPAMKFILCATMFSGTFVRGSEGWKICVTSLSKIRSFITHSKTLKNQVS